MNRISLFLCLLFSVAVRAAEPTITAEVLPSPCGVNSVGSTLAVSPEGVAWLTWLETSTDQTVSLRFSTLDPATRRWAAPRTITAAANLHAGASDFPALTVGRGGRATVLYYVTNPASAETAHLHHGAGYHAVTRSTIDGGQTWSAATKLSVESDINEFASLATLADGRVLAAWLDARVKKALGPHAAHAEIKPAQQLLARIVGADGPDQLVDGKVCDCCHTTLTAFPDGTALLAYRGRSDDEARDIRFTRFRGASWDDTRVLNADDWRINGCPVNGPQLASDGGRVAAAWFTAADNDPRVLVSFSPDAGDRFLMPLRLSAPKAAGRVSTILLHDGAMLASWIDADGMLTLRRVTPDYSASRPATRLTAPEQGRIKGFPRLALLRDYRGDNTTALLLATFTREASSKVETLLITVPEGELLQGATDCDCTPAPEQLRGYPIRGSIVSVDRERGQIRIRHAEVPGMFPAGTREFRVATNLLRDGTVAGREFMGRFERAGDDWQLSEIRLIASAPR